MKNAKVVFATKTQHSKKIAVALGGELGVEALNILNGPHVSDAELLVIVGGIYAGKSNPDILAFAEKLTSETTKKAILVTSSASVSNRSQREVWKVLVKNGIEVIDEVSCTGAFLFLKPGHPSKTDIRGIVEKVTDLVGFVQ